MALNDSCDSRDKELFAAADEAIAGARQRIQDFVTREMELADTFLRVAEVERTMGEREASARSVEDAWKACEVSRRFLTQFRGAEPALFDHQERRIASLEAAIQQFRSPAKN